MIGIVALVLAFAGATSGARAAPRAGCQGWRPAVAYHAGGLAVAPAPDAAPIPCAVLLGRSSESALVGATGDGANF